MRNLGDEVLALGSIANGKYWALVADKNLITRDGEAHMYLPSNAPALHPSLSTQGPHVAR